MPANSWPKVTIEQDKELKKGRDDFRSGMWASWALK